VGLQIFMKQKINKYRNPFNFPARKRKGGPMRDKRTKRLNGKNKQLAYLEDNY